MICIEDSDVTEKEIEAGFGKEISDLVSALSFDPKIEDKREQTQEHFNHIRTFGKSDALIKTADLYCNLPFVNYVNDFNTHSYLQYKYGHLYKLPKLQIWSYESLVKSTF